MHSTTESIARKVGRIDALLFFAGWSCVGLFSAAHPWGALPVIVFLLFPASALVGWRGAAVARAICNGVASLKRVLIEGFLSGAGFVMLVFLWGVASSAYAAGGHFDGLSPMQADFWRVVLTYLLPYLLAGGAVGSIHAVAFFYLNRWLIRANLSFQGTASGRP